MNNECLRLIRENKAHILDRWHAIVLAIFPEKMHTSTPLAQALSEVLEDLLDAIDGPPEKHHEALNKVIRILAVQDFPPSRTMSLFFELKSILRDIAPGKLKQKHWDDIQTHMEHLTLEAFDSYMAHREKIYQLKVEESTRQTFMMSRRTKT